MEQKNNAMITFHQVFVRSYSARGKGLVDYQERERHGRGGGGAYVTTMYKSFKLHSALSEIVTLV